MKIQVNFKDYGFFSQTPITVQRIDWHKDEGEGYKDVLWCNHDGHEIQENTRQIINVDSQDQEWTTNDLVCDKCEAYKPEHEDYWQDAPFEGVTQ